MRIPLLVLAVTSCVGFASAVPALAQHRHAASDSNAHHAIEQGFDVAMAEAMRRMDRDMAIAHTGNADRDFAALMIPHHQGAIDMARAELLYGRDPVLRRLAEGIIVEQQQEIELMRRELERMGDARQNVVR
jgi:uncharacterized protein (DUF305 family)